MPHAHHLVKKEDNKEFHDFHEIEVSVENGHIAAYVFQIIFLFT